MKVILLADVKGQGKKNDVIEVSDGYGKNFLIPRKLAKPADAQSLNDVKVKEAARVYRIETEKKEAKALAEKLQTIQVKIAASSGGDGRLYGSVTSKDIAEELKKIISADVDKRKILLKDPIKAYGSYTVEIKILADISAKFTVNVHE